MLWKHILVIGIFLIVLVSLIFITNRIFDLISNKTKEIHYKFINEIINVVLVFIMIVILMQQFEVTRAFTAQIVTGGTLLIAILTFAAQKTLGNIISGTFVSISKPFKLGEKIRIQNTSGFIMAEGVVEDITLRHIVIKSYDKKRYIISNSTIDESVIVNLDVEDISATYFAVVSYDADLDKACELLVQTCEEIEEFNGHGKPYIKEYTDNGVRLGITTYAETSALSFEGQTKFYKELLRKYKEAGIVIPYQTITIDPNSQDAW